MSVPSMETKILSPAFADQQRAKIVSVTLTDEQAKRIESLLDAHLEADGGTHQGIERAWWEVLLLKRILHKGRPRFVSCSEK
jgi:hypothetical protein